MSFNRNDKPSQKDLVSKPGWWKIPGLGSSIIKALELILKQSPTLAQHWRPLLDPIQEHLDFLNVEMKKISGTDDKDLRWKNFLDKQQALIEKLKPLLDELSKETPHTTLLLTQLEAVLNSVPPLMVQFNKLKLHEKAKEYLTFSRALQNNPVGIIEQELQKRLPHYETFKASVAEEYAKFKDKDSLKHFSNLSPLEKITRLAAMGEFNLMLEWGYLMLNRLGLELDIPEGYLLDRRLFVNNTLSMKDFYEKFTKFYLNALENAGFPKPLESDLYPYLEKIIDVQKEVYEEHMKATAIMTSVERKKQLGTDAILLTLGMEIDNRTHLGKNKSEDELLKKLLDKLTKSFNDKDLSHASLNAILNDVMSALTTDELKLIEKDPTVEAIKETARDSETEIKNLMKEWERKRLSIENRIATNKAKRKQTQADEKNEPISPRVFSPVKNPNIKKVAHLALDIYEQVKAAQEIYSRRIKSDTSSVGLLNKAVSYLYSQLEIMLDKNIYNQYIKSADIMFAGEGWIADLGATLNKLSELVDKYNKLTVYFVDNKVAEINPNLNTPKEHLIAFTEKVRDSAIILKELATCYVKLQSNPFVVSLLSAGGYKKIFFLDHDEDLQQPQQELAPAVPEALPENETNSLKKLFAIATSFYEKSATKHFYSDAKMKSNLQAFGRLQVMIEKYNDYTEVDENIFKTDRANILRFMLQNLLNINQFFYDLPETFGALHAVSKDEFFRLATQWNKSLRDFILLLNRIEIEFHLKPGYFTQLPLKDLLAENIRKSLRIDKLPANMPNTSLQALIMKSYKMLGDLNYTFAENESYPFTQAIHAQRIEIYRKTPAHTIKKSYLDYLFMLARVQAKDATKEKQAEAQQQKRNLAATLNQLLNDKISNLKLEYSAETKIQRRLLKRLISSATTPRSLDYKLNRISASNTDRKYFHLLYKGHVKKLVLNLQTKSVTRKDIINEIDVQINQLSQRRLQNYYFFAQSRRKTLEDTLHALAELKKFLAKQGHKVKDFENTHPNEFKILLNFDKNFLLKLHKMSRDSLTLSQEKKILGTNEQIPAKQFSDNEKSFINHQQNMLLAQRINALQAPTWFKSSTKTKKVQLLIALNNNLKTLSLESSLDAIHRHPELSVNYYLLHEGQTGKMIKQLSQLNSTKTDMINQVSVEIARLKQKRTVNYYFSEQNKKMLIETRIQACLSLQEKLNKLEFIPALKSLTEAERKILLKYELKLLNELNQWDIMHSSEFSNIAVVKHKKT